MRGHPDIEYPAAGAPSAAALSFEEKGAAISHRRYSCQMVIAAIFWMVAAVVESPGQQVGSWRLLKTPNPRGGADAVSIVHIADTARSDLELAGLMVKCDQAHPQVAIVVVTPFPPHVQLSVTVRANATTWHFEGHAGPDGVELLLPAEATDLATGAWQSAHELSVSASSPGRTLNGVILIDGLGPALAELTANCPAD